MTSTQNLKDFTIRVLHIMPRNNDLFSNGVPGEGTSNIASAAAQKLQRAALDFDRAYRNSAVQQPAVQGLGHALEGALMAATTFDILTEKNAMELVDSLHDLVESRAVV